MLLDEVWYGIWPALPFFKCVAIPALVAYPTVNPCGDSQEGSDPVLYWSNLPEVAPVVLINAVLFGADW